MLLPPSNNHAHQVRRHRQGPQGCVAFVRGTLFATRHIYFLFWPKISDLKVCVVVWLRMNEAMLLLPASSRQIPLAKISHWTTQNDAFKRHDRAQWPVSVGGSQFVVGVPPMPRRLCQAECNCNYVVEAGSDPTKRIEEWQEFDAWF